MNKPALTSEGLKPCPCGCDTFYMSVTAKTVPEDVTCCRCRRGFNPYTGEYVVEPEWTLVPVPATSEETVKVPTPPHPVQ